MWAWQPIPDPVWRVSSAVGRIVLWTLFSLGWLFLFISSRLINEKHLFGLKQVGEYLRGKKLSSPKFQTPGFYRFSRHPMMLGFLIAFWATPQMSQGHLLFAATLTLYIIIGTRLEERDLKQFFGDRYRQYQRHVAMLIPGLMLKPGNNRPVEEEHTYRE